MIKPELLEYIRTQLQRGVTEDEVRSILAGAGWDAGTINTTLSVSVYEGDFAIETADLTKYYGKSRGIVSLDLFVRTGEIFGFLGPNGAGKSTTIRLLLGLIKPTSGALTVLGGEYGGSTPVPTSEIGYLPGDVRLYPKMTGRAMLALAESFHRNKHVAPFRNELIERLECELDMPFAQLSKGNRQKLGILLALFHKPQLAVLDEPTSGLDPLTQNEFYGVLRELQRDGTTVFFSSHNLHEVDHICDRVGIIRQGQLVDVETVDFLRGHQQKVVELRAAGPISNEQFSAIAGVTVFDSGDDFLRMHVDDEAMPAVLARISAAGLSDITITNPDLEQVFLKYYGTPTP